MTLIVRRACCSMELDASIVESTREIILPMHAEGGGLLG